MRVCVDRLAVNTIHFFNIASMMYGTVVDECSAPGACAHMSAGTKYVYYWGDEGEDLPAHEYITRLFDWIESLIADPKVCLWVL